MRKALVAGAALIVLVATEGVATTFYVDLNWTGATTNGSASAPFATIKAALDVCNTNAQADTILVAKGVYKSLLSSGLENFGAQGLIISNTTSFYGGYTGWVSGVTFDWVSRAPRSSIIDLAGAGTRAFYRGGGAIELNWMITLDGFTFQNANHTADGGVIGSQSGQSHTGWLINDCLFTNNVTTGRGGAVDMYAQWNYSGIVTNCDFIANSGTNGGAVYVQSGSFTGNNSYKIVNSTFRTNTATADGGALYMVAGGVSPIDGCRFFDNRAFSRGGGAVFTTPGSGQQIQLRKCQFLRNTATSGSAIYALQNGGRSASVILENCLFSQNVATNYTLYSDGQIMTTIYGFDLSFCTLADNTGGGIWSSWYYNATYGSGGCVRARSSIIFSNGNFGVYYLDNAGTYPNPPLSAIEYSDVYSHKTNYGGSAFGSRGTITNDPVFMSVSGTNYFMLWNGPCVNSATNLSVTTDLAEVARPQHLGYDMGCYEMIPPATILTVPATNVALLAGNLNAILSATSAAPTTVTVYWGTQDGGIAWNWGNTNGFGSQSAGLLTTNINLSSNTVYYYRYLASNDLGWVWSETSQVFMTSEVWIDRAAQASESGLVPGTFTLHRASTATNAAITAFFTTSGSAVAGQHYVSIGTSVTFQAGSDVATLTVTPINDSGTQFDTTVRVTLASGPYIIGSPAMAEITISNVPPQAITLAATDTTADEQNQGTGMFTLTRSGYLSDPVTVNYSITGSVTAADYVAAPLLTGSLTLAANQSTTNIVITPVLDWFVEGTETLTLQLKPGSYDINAPSNGTVSFTDYSYAAFSTLYVDVNWTNLNGLGTSTNPSVSINRALTAIDEVAGVKTVLVARGVYSATNNGGYENFGASGLLLSRTVGKANILLFGGYTGWVSGVTFDWASRTPRSSVIDLTNAGTRAFCRAGTSDLDWFPTIDGFTFKNANHTNDGGAIGAQSGQNHTGWLINNCLFTNNTTTGSGGAASLYGQYTYSITVTNCDFVSNSATNGGAITIPSGGANNHYIEKSLFRNNTAGMNGGAVYLYMGGGAPVIENCRFEGNRAATNGEGGAVYFVSPGTALTVALMRDTFASNSARYGGAISIRQGAARSARFYLENCLLYGNTATNYTIYHDGGICPLGWGVDLAHTTLANNFNGGIYSAWLYNGVFGEGGNVRVIDSIVANNGAYGIYYDYSSSVLGSREPVIQYSDVYGHSTANYGDDAYPGDGVISLDPFFRDPANGDYHLNWASRCVNKGTNLSITVDIDGTNRPLPVTGRYDMGCYEMVPPPLGAVFVVH